MGTHSGLLQIWDVVKGKLIREMFGHSGRICTISWSSKYLSTGSRDKTILNRDFRSRTDFEAKLTGHKQEVCGLKWSFDE